MCLICLFVVASGQGYIWLAHKTPGSETWELAARSKQLWEELAESIRDQGKDPAEVLGWKKTGISLLNFVSCADFCDAIFGLWLFAVILITFQV